MGQKLRDAAEAGLLVGVKSAVALLIVSLAAIWLVRSYGLVSATDLAVLRQQAENGQRAFQFLLEREAAPPAAPPTP